MKPQVLVFGLPEAKQLTEQICHHLKITPQPMEVFRFANGEIFCKPQVSVRNQKVVLVQSLANPVNESLMTLLIAIDALKRASAAEINLVLPYYAYARQDRKNRGREPISAKLVADLLSTAGASRMVSVDVHSDQIQGFFNFPVDTLRAVYCLVNALIDNEQVEQLTIVSPDYGGIKRARKMSELLQVPLAIVDKRRPKPNEVVIESVLGEIAGRNCILVDDLIDTGNTLYQAAKLLKAKGAKKVYALATHGLFSANAVDLFNQAYDQGVIDKIYVADTLAHVYDLPIKSLVVVSISEFLSEIVNIYASGVGSVGELYWKHQQKIVQALDD